jgi:lipoate-protein ligase B
LEYQEELFKGIVDLKFEIAEKILNYQLKIFSFVEHPHIYTLGKSGDLSNLLLSEKQLETRLLFTKSIVVVTSPITDLGQLWVILF